MNSFNMKTYFTSIAAVILVLSSFCSFAQEGQQNPPPNSLNNNDNHPSTPLRDRFFFGGNLGLQFGSATYIDISPLVGYKITPKLHAGVGATYMYYKYKDAYFNYESSTYGGRVLGRYYPIESLFAHVEYEVLNIKMPSTVSGQNYDKYIRQNIASVLVGGGYVQPIGSNASMMLMILFNLNEQQYSPYTNPIFRVGFSAGF